MKNDKDYIFLIFCLKTSNSCEIRQKCKKCEKSIKKVFTLSFWYDIIKLSSTKRKENKMKYLPKTENEFNKENPFEPVFGKNLTKQQKNETIAHFIYEVTKINGYCANGTIYNTFKSWSSNTIESGIDFYRKIKFDAMFGSHID